MRKALICVVAIACVALLGTVANAQCGVFGVECLVNGNLDIGTQGDGTMTGTAPPWTVITSGSPSAAIFQPGFADSTGLHGIWYRAFTGGTTGASAELSQTTIPVLMDGRYRLTFDYLVETNFTAASATASLVSSGGDVDSLDMLSVPRTGIGGGFVNNPAEVGSLTVNALAGDTLTVSLAMIDGISGPTNPQSMVADRFSLVKIPEPGTLLLAGLSMVGLLGLRRRS